MTKESVGLQSWAMGNEPDVGLARSSFWPQIIFIRDKVTAALAHNFEDQKIVREHTIVIAEHTSKSVRLPVVQITLADGTTFTMRNNFYDWKVSVSTPHSVEVDFMGLFDPAKDVGALSCCEGFPTELVYGSYASNNQQFTIELPQNSHFLFTFLWIFTYQVLEYRK